MTPYRGWVRPSLIEGESNCHTSSFQRDFLPMRWLGERGLKCLARRLFKQGEEINVCHGGFIDEFSSWKHSHFHGVRDPSSLHFQTLPRSTFPSSNGDSREDKFRPFLNPSLRAPARLSLPFARHGLIKKNPRGGQLAHDDPRGAMAVPRG